MLNKDSFAESRPASEERVEWAVLMQPEGRESEGGGAEGGGEGGEDGGSWA